jgi:antitoxin component YwqK of YwqJK toxin-antitoxin module
MKVAVLVASFTTAVCTAPEARAVEDLVRESGIYLDPVTMEPYSGPAFATFSGQPSVVAQRLRMKDGAYHGPFEAYFENHQLSSKEMYEAGVKHGPYEWYFDSGRLFEKGTYHEGHLDGPYEAFWDSGALYEEGNYRHGEFDGPRRWYLEGQLIELVTYVNGTMEGPYERYTEDGRLDLKGTLSAGSPCGTWTEAQNSISYPGCGTSIVD